MPVDSKHVCSNQTDFHSAILFIQVINGLTLNCELHFVKSAFS